MSSTIEPSGAIEIAPIEDTSLLAFYRDMNLAGAADVLGLRRRAGRSTAWIS